MSKSNLELVHECDNFPYPDQKEEYTALVGSYYFFRLLESWTPTCTKLVTVGYILPSVAQKMPWTPSFHVDHSKRHVSIPYSSTPDHESTVLAELLSISRKQDTFSVLRGWRNELYPILELNRPVAMERAGSALFGIQTIGAHMVGFTRISGTNELKVWVPRRAATKQTYGGMLDNTVAGGIAAGEDQFECIVREAAEEASLEEEFARANARICSTISYFYVRDERAGGETGLLQPETQYVYEIEIPEGMVPKPADGEVEEFYLWSMGKVKEALARGEFKPNCAVCLIDVLIRHGEINPGNDKDYLELNTRIHRRLAFEQ